MTSSVALRHTPRHTQWSPPRCTADGVVAVSTIAGWRCPFCGAAVPDRQG